MIGTFLVAGSDAITLIVPTGQCYDKHRARTCGGLQRHEIGHLQYTSSFGQLWDVAKCMHGQPVPASF